VVAKGQSGNVAAEPNNQPHKTIVLGGVVMKLVEGGVPVGSDNRCLPTEEYILKVVKAEKLSESISELTVEVLEGQYDGRRTNLAVPFDAALTPGMCFMAKIRRIAGSLINTLTQWELLGYEWTAT
jgi:hypothetical protein